MLEIVSLIIGIVLCSTGRVGIGATLLAFTFLSVVVEGVRLAIRSRARSDW